MTGWRLLTPLSAPIADAAASAETAGSKSEPSSTIPTLVRSRSSETFVTPRFASSEIAPSPRLKSPSDDSSSSTIVATFRSFQN